MASMTSTRRAYTPSFLDFHKASMVRADASSALLCCTVSYCIVLCLYVLFEFAEIWR